MAFNNTSFFAGLGTAFAAIAVGFAGGAMITTSAVQPPNRLERVSSNVTPPTNPTPAPSQAAPSTSEQSGNAKPTPDVQPSTVAAAPAALAPDPQVNQQPPATAAAPAKTDVATTAPEPTVPAAKAQASPQTTRNEDKREEPSPTKSERASARSSDQNREVSRRRAEERKSSDERKFSERRRRQEPDQRRLDEATNVVRQMPRVGDEIVLRDDAPRVVPRRRIEIFGDEEPRMINEPSPRFGLFGE